MFIYSILFLNDVLSFPVRDEHNIRKTELLELYENAWNKRGQLLSVFLIYSMKLKIIVVYFFCFICGKITT